MNTNNFQSKNLEAQFEIAAMEASAEQCAHQVPRSVLSAPTQQTEEGDLDII